jgi:hypothetical protein
MMPDWGQLREIVTAPDNVPVLGLIPALGYFLWLGWRQARANDAWIEALSCGAEAPATESRGDRLVPVWPYLLRVEFLAALVVTVLLLVWSFAIDAPLEAPANPSVTMNPAKAPWYFVGLQELLVYFDPWFAGVVLPALIIVGLMLFPYLDASPLRGGYYSLKQRRVPLAAFLGGFAIWIGAILVGVFLRGPGWAWFWPGETWVHSQAAVETTRDLPDLLGIHGAWGKGFAGLVALGALYWGAARGIRWLVSRSEIDRATLARTSRLQYRLFEFFAFSILVLVPVKILLRLVLHVKYILATGWLNV